MRNPEVFKAQHLLTGTILSVAQVGLALEVRTCSEPAGEKLNPVIMLARSRGRDFGYRFGTTDQDTGQLYISPIEEYEITEAGPRFVTPMSPLWQPSRRTLEVTASLMNTHFLLNRQLEYRQVAGSVSRSLDPEFKNSKDWTTN